MTLDAAALDGSPLGLFELAGLLPVQAAAAIPGMGVPLHLAVLLVALESSSSDT